MSEEILKLNQRITGLLTENVNLAETNQRLKRDFDNLKGVMEHHRRSAIESCELSDKYKFDLEKEIQIREAIFEAHQKQKTKFLSLNEDNYLLRERVKTLENTIEHRRPSQIFGNRFSIMGSLRSLQQPETNNRMSLSRSPVRRSTGPSRKTQEIERLQKKVEDLKKEKTELYDLINDLEFELDTIVYYEQEIEHLRAEINELTVKDSKSTNPFETEELDNKLSITNEEQTSNTGSEEKRNKRIELHNKLKQLLSKQEEAGTSSTSNNPNYDMHEKLKSI